jgi:hypothetical protein
MKKIILFLVIGLGFLCASPVVKLKKYKPAAGVSVKLPQDFLVMSDDDIAARYPNYRKPIAMYTAPNGRTDFGVNTANNLWGKNLGILKDVYKASLMNLFAKVTFLQDTVMEVNKRKVIVLEFISEQPPRATSQRQETIQNYSYITYAVVDKRIFIFNFSTPDYLREEWQPVAHQIMKTIKVNATAASFIPDNSVIAPKTGKSAKDIMLEQRKNKSFPKK